MNIEIEAHEITNLFPLMNAEEFTALKQDIQRNGLQEAIWTFRGKIVDGRARHRACVELGMNLQLREWPGKGSLIEFILSLNLHRRHLSSSQKAVVALEVEKLLAMEAKANMSVGGGDKRSNRAGTGSKKVEKVIHAAKQAASLTGTNATYVAAAKKVAASAPELLEAVSNRVITIPEARQVSTLSINDRRAVVEKVSSGKAKNVKDARSMVRTEKQQLAPARIIEAPRRYLIARSTIEKAVNKIKPEVVDVIITDPPYPKEYLSVYETLAQLAFKALKPGGSMLVMTGHVYLPEILALMTRVPGIKYHWICNYDMPGAKAQVWSHKVITTCKPVLWFVKGKYDGDWRYDKFTSDVRDKEHHEWGQSVSGMNDIVRRFTKPGDLILDPFLGGGTTGIAALKLGRRFMGLDADDRAVTTSNARIAKMLEEEQGAKSHVTVSRAEVTTNIGVAA
ncbi:MAG TPA: DNA modification methylase [Pyrinomonadaceae bacterium]|nr:DNA modification methylase [Pyrinomonadaceae bacterium]